MAGNVYNYAPSADQELQASLFQQGDEKALAYFYGAFYPALCHFAYGWTQSLPIAQEIASEAFIKTWRMHHKLDSYAGIRAYLYTTVRHDCLYALKRAGKQAMENKLLPRALEDPDTPFQLLVRAETYRRLQAAINTLSPGNRRVITMHFLEGKTTTQIARELNLHPNTVQTQKARGLKALRKIIRHPLFLSLFFFPKIF